MVESGKIHLDKEEEMLLSRLLAHRSLLAFVVTFALMLLASVFGLVPTMGLGWPWVPGLVLLYVFAFILFYLLASVLFVVWMELAFLVLLKVEDSERLASICVTIAATAGWLISVPLVYVCVPNGGDASTLIVLARLVVGWAAVLIFVLVVDLDGVKRLLRGWW